ncbi:MAG: C2 family cysteine protease [Gammaproteobacteria bacterium]|nr:C2 family cysteine protease [Gammaproteobacteria bacterium]
MNPPIVCSIILASLVSANASATTKAHPVAAEHNVTTKSSATKTTATSPTAKTATTAKTTHKEKSSTTTQTSLKTSTTAFTASVSDNFHHWAHDRRHLTTADVANQLKNTNIKGLEAAALAAIAARMNGLTTWYPHTLAEINQKLQQNGITPFSTTKTYTKDDTVRLADLTITLVPVKGSHPQTFTTRVDFTEKQLKAMINAQKSALYSNYEAAMSAIVESTTPQGGFKLYGNSDSPPPLSDIRQWRDGDCYLVSSVGGLLQDDPQAIKKMITPVSGTTDQYTVQFPGYSTPITVTLTKAEVGMYSHVVGGGAWLAILSVAEAEVRDPNNTNPMSIIHGGQQTQVLTLLTGNNYGSLSLNGSQSQTQQLSNTLSAASKSSSSSSSSAYLTNIGTPIGIETDGHALLITGYNPQTGMVTIWNPWGTTGKYSPTSGVTFSMTNGMFNVPISELNQDGFVKVSLPEK